MGSERAHVFVEGRVQGVYFRDSTRGEAVEHGVAGWVRNLSDGRVEAVLEGPRERVERVVAFCREGPPHARVDGIAITWEEAEGLEGFEVRHTL